MKTPNYTARENMVFDKRPDTIDRFAETYWDKQDLIDELKYYANVDPTDENIQLLYDNIDAQELSRIMIDGGLCYIHEVVDDLFSKGLLKKI